MRKSLTAWKRLVALITILFLFSLPLDLFGEEGETSRSTVSVEDVPSGGKDHENILFDAFDKGYEKREVPDPFEPLNRASFWFNDKFYFYLFKPVARAYRIVPEPARRSVSNVFTNLKAPVRFINSLLQLKFGDAGSELARFVINTTVGIGGLFDPARKWAGIKMKEEDFGQTLGHYGVGPGNFVVLPLLGPSNTRDGFGDLVDIFMDPITYSVGNFGEYFAVKSFDGLTQASLDKDTYEGIKKRALDPYIFLRNTYWQRRMGLVSK